MTDKQVATQEPVQLLQAF